MGRILFLVLYGGVTALAWHNHIFTKRFWLIGGILVAWTVLKTILQRIPPKGSAVGTD